MKCRATAVVAIVGISALLVLSCDGLAIGTGLRGNPDRTIIDHSDANVDGITAARIAHAKKDLVIAYWHTSHGSQLITGINGMDEFYGGKGWYTLNGDGGLQINEQGSDLGNPGLADFETSVRTYLPAHPDTNVVMASWCGQVSGASEEMIQEYLDRMSALEASYPNVTFVYMTGHSDGSGDGSDGQQAGNLHLRDRQIRKYCVDNHKWLFDFYDIECYDPDGVNYGNRYVDDNCDYDANGDGGHDHYEISADNWVAQLPDHNWAIDWQSAHPGEWWDSGAAHSQSLNGNQKAKAAWQLWCAIAETK